MERKASAHRVVKAHLNKEAYEPTPTPTTFFKGLIDTFHPPKKLDPKKVQEIKKENLTLEDLIADFKKDLPPYLQKKFMDILVLVSSPAASGLLASENKN